jgi:hypothetical protein
MSLEGGKGKNTRKAHRHQRSKSYKKHMKTNKNKGTSILKSWVAFVKKVQKEEKISYRDAMFRAKARKSEWKKEMKGGEPDKEEVVEEEPVVEVEEPVVEVEEPVVEVEEAPVTQAGGKKRKHRKMSMRKAQRKARASRKN